MKLKKEILSLANLGLATFTIVVYITVTALLWTELVRGSLPNKFEALPYLLLSPFAAWLSLALIGLVISNIKLED